VGSPRHMFACVCSFPTTGTSAAQLATTNISFFVSTGPRPWIIISCGYRVMDGKRMLGPDGKRRLSVERWCMTLPLHWQEFTPNSPSFPFTPTL